MGVILGLLAALGWGSADFLAQYATRHIGSYRTLFFIQFVGLAGLSVVMLVTGSTHYLSHFTGETWIWMGLAAILYTVSTLALYRAFEVGKLALVSPIAASYAALTTLLAFVSGEQLTLLHSLGIGIALVGVILAVIPQAPETGMWQKAKTRTRGIGWAIGAAFGLGVTFWILGFHVTPTLGGITPIWLLRLVAPALLILGAHPLKQTLNPPSGHVWRYLIGIGLLDTGAFVANALGFTMAQISLVSVLGSLFSAVTVLLAWIILHEQLFWRQWLGVSSIFLGIILVNS